MAFTTLTATREKIENSLLLRPVEGWNFVPIKLSNHGANENIYSAISLAHQYRMVDKRNHPSQHRYRFAAFSVLTHACILALLYAMNLQASVPLTNSGGTQVVDIMVIDASQLIGKHDQFEQNATKNTALQTNNEKQKLQENIVVSSIPSHEQPVKIVAHEKPKHSPQRHNKQEKPKHVTRQISASQAGQGSKAVGDDFASAHIHEMTASYQKQVATHLARHKQYPNEAKSKGIKGQTVVTFSIDATGHLLRVQLAASSGHDILDQETRDTVRRSEPFPSIPSDIGKRTMNFTVPLRYDLRS